MTIALYVLSCHLCSAPEFEASKYLITNREFFEFVNAGGYKNRQYWTDEGLLHNTLYMD